MNYSAVPARGSALGGAGARLGGAGAQLDSGARLDTGARLGVGALKINSCCCALCQDLGFYGFELLRELVGLLARAVDGGP